jgi:catechol 2,3-dioxygenase-like lactoylglutathione lyase family enzyme
MSATLPDHTVKRVGPMLAAADMEKTFDFYTTILGFAVTMKSPEYSIVERDGATIHFMKADDESVMQAVRGHAESGASLARSFQPWPTPGKSQCALR